VRRKYTPRIPAHTLNTDQTRAFNLTLGLLPVTHLTCLGPQLAARLPHRPRNHDPSSYIPVGFVSAHPPDPGWGPLRGWSSYSWQHRVLCQRIVALGCAFPPNGVIRGCSCQDWNLAGVWDHLCGKWVAERRWLDAVLNLFRMLFDGREED
jgi:hypothetical protein